MEIEGKHKVKICLSAHHKGKDGDFYESHQVVFITTQITVIQYNITQVYFNSNGYLYM